MEYKDKLIAAVRSLAGHKVMIIGDCMLDHYLAGDVSRISPEAPVPVVHVTREEYLLGGAGNVARNIAALGGSPHLISLVGDDEDGRTVRTLLEADGVSCRLVADGLRPTTRKTRILAQNQQIVRVDMENAAPLEGEPLDAVFAEIERHIDSTAVIILSDYGKGVISREFMERLRSLMGYLERKPLILVDPKTVNYDLYQGVDLLTPNTKEASEGAGLPPGMHADGPDAVIAAGLALFRRLGCNHLLITLGGEGMALFESPERVRHIPTFARKVFDVTGAGDTVIAALALALSAGCGLLTAATLANYAAGITVGQIGAAVATPEEIVDAVLSLPAPAPADWLG